MILTLPPHDLADVNRRSVALADMNRASAAYATAELTLLARALRNLWGNVVTVLFNKDHDDDGDTNITLLVITDRDGNLLWFNNEYAPDYPGAAEISDDRGRLNIPLDEEAVREIELLLTEAYDAVGGMPQHVDSHYDEHLTGNGDINNLLVLDIDALLAASEPAPGAERQHSDPLVEVLALLDRLESSGQDYDLDTIRAHVPEGVRGKLASQVNDLNRALRPAGY